MNVLNLIKTGISLILGGIFAQLLTNYSDYKKQEKEFINRVVCAQEGCLYEISKYMEDIENYPQPYKFTSNDYLENRCKEFRIEKENFKKEYYKISRKVKMQIEKFNQIFDYIAKFNMEELKTAETHEIQIRNNYNEMKKINQSIRINFKL